MADPDLAEAREQVLRLAASFEALGLAPGERVALMMPNLTEHWLADQAVVHACGLPVTFYSTLPPGQIAVPPEDCDARVAVVYGQHELALWQAGAGYRARGEDGHRARSGRPPGR